MPIYLPTTIFLFLVILMGVNDNSAALQAILDTITKATIVLIRECTFNFKKKIILCRPFIPETLAWWSCLEVMPLLQGIPKLKVWPFSKGHNFR
jgi:hypothetical protein